MSRYQVTWLIHTNTSVYNKIPCGILQFVCPQLEVWFDLDLHESFQLLAYGSPINKIHIRNQNLASYQIILDRKY